MRSFDKVQACSVGINERKEREAGMYASDSYEK